MRLADGRPFRRWLGHGGVRGFRRRLRNARLGLGRRLRFARLGHGRRNNRQERKWIDVALRVDGHAHSEVHRRKLVLDPVARPDHGDRVALGHGRAARDGECAEVEQRHRVPVRRLDRDRPAVAGHGADEADEPAMRGANRRPGSGPDVDAAVEPRRVGVVSEQKRS